VAVSDPGAGVPLWVRVTHNTTTGAVNFYTSSDGVTYSALGTQQTITAGVPFDPDDDAYDPVVSSVTDQWVLGASFSGRIYEAEIRNGIDGPCVNPRPIDAWEALADGVFAGAPVLDVVNASHPGATLAYFLDATRQPKVLQNFRQALTLVNLGHNQAGLRGQGFAEYYGSLLAAVQARLPMTNVVVVTQNPKVAPATHILAHSLRLQQIHSYAQAHGYDVIDVYRHFAAHEDLASLMSADGIHPNATGGAFWANVVGNVLEKS
jgi:lysophospholipase L1-like esterase